MSERAPSLGGGLAALTLAAANAAFVAPTPLLASVAAVAGVAGAVVLGGRAVGAVSGVGGVVCSVSGAAGLWVAVGLVAVSPVSLRVRVAVGAAVLGVVAFAFALAPLRRAWTGPLVAAGFAAALAAALARSVVTPVPVWYPAVTVAVTVLAWDTAKTAVAVGEGRTDRSGAVRVVGEHVIASGVVGSLAVGGAVAAFTALPRVTSRPGATALVGAAVLSLAVLAVDA